MPLLRYLLPAVTWIIAVGGCLGLIWGLVTSWHLTSHGFLFPAFGHLISKINQVIFYVSGVVVVLAYELTRRATAHRPLAALVSTGVCFLPVFAYLGLLINRRYLPSFFELKTIAWNIILSLIFLALWLISSWLVSRWQEARKELLAGLVGILIILNTVKHVHSSVKPFDHPNVLILMVDSLRADHLSCYGYHRKTSPHIDELAKDSVVFTHAISQSTFTKASIASLFTGRYTFQHGVYSGNRNDRPGQITSDVLSEDEDLLFEALQRDGFLTAGWISNTHLQPRFGFAQGFVEYNAGGRAGEIEVINQAFRHWLRTTGRHEQFASYLHYMDLHDPYRPKAPYDKMYGVYSDVYKDVNFSEFGAYLDEVEDGKQLLSKQDIDQLIAYYDGQISYMDKEIGELLAELKKLDLYDDLMIVLTSDHGDAFMEHGFISHSRVPYDELVKVPLIIKFPDSRHKGGRVEAQVQLVDVMPTVLEVVGQTSNATLAGVSLLNYLVGGGAAEADELSQRLAFSEVLIDGKLVTAVRTLDWKYLRFEGDEGREELYNLESDPQEKINRLDSQPDELEGFREAIAMATAARGSRSAERQTLDEETIQKLKSLGYIK